MSSAKVIFFGVFGAGVSASKSESSSESEARGILLGVGGLSCVCFVGLLDATFLRRPR